MYPTKIFEEAIKICGYTIKEIKYTDKSREVRKVIGTVPISKKVTIDGQRKTAIYHKKVRWDATGRVFRRDLMYVSGSMTYQFQQYYNGKNKRKNSRTWNNT